MLIHVSPQSRLQCEMSVSKYRARDVVSKVKPVQVESVGRDGMRFTTELRMPPDPGLLLAFSIRFDGKAAKPRGSIVEVRARPDGRYAYEIKFEPVQGYDTEIGWLELLLSLSVDQRLRYVQTTGAYKEIGEAYREQAVLDLRG